MFNFVRNLPNYLPKWLYPFALPPAINESFSGSVSPPAFGGVSVVDLGDFSSSRYVLLFSQRVVLLFSEIPRPVARQAPLSMGFSRQEYWSGLLFPSPG